MPGGVAALGLAEPVERRRARIGADGVAAGPDQPLGRRADERPGQARGADAVLALAVEPGDQRCPLDGRQGRPGPAEPELAANDPAVGPAEGRADRPGRPPGPLAGRHGPERAGDPREQGERLARPVLPFEQLGPFQGGHGGQVRSAGLAMGLGDRPEQGLGLVAIRRGPGREPAGPDVGEAGPLGRVERRRLGGLGIVVEAGEPADGGPAERPLGVGRPVGLDQRRRLRPAAERRQGPEPLQGRFPDERRVGHRGGAEVHQEAVAGEVGGLPVAAGDRQGRGDPVVLGGLPEDRVGRRGGLDRLEDALRLTGPAEGQQRPGDHRLGDPGPAVVRAAGLAGRGGGLAEGVEGRLDARSRRRPPAGRRAAGRGAGRTRGGRRTRGRGACGGRRSSRRGRAAGAGRACSSRPPGRRRRSAGRPRRRRGGRAPGRRRGRSARRAGRRTRGGRPGGGRPRSGRPGDRSPMSGGPRPSPSPGRWARCQGRKAVEAASSRGSGPAVAARASASITTTRPLASPSASRRPCGSTGSAATTVGPAGPASCRASAALGAAPSTDRSSRTLPSQAATRPSPPRTLASPRPTLGSGNRQPGPSRPSPSTTTAGPPSAGATSLASAGPPPAAATVGPSRDAGPARVRDRRSARPSSRRTTIDRPPSTTSIPRTPEARPLERDSATAGPSARRSGRNRRSRPSRSPTSRSPGPTGKTASAPTAPQSSRSIAAASADPVAQSVRPRSSPVTSRSPSTTARARRPPLPGSARPIDMGDGPAPGR